MPSPYFDARDARNAKLQVAIAAFDHQLIRLGHANDPDGSALAEVRASWTALVALLALELPHELSQCPNCKHFGMRAATRCGHCWAKLVPPASAAPTDSTT